MPVVRAKLYVAEMKRQAYDPSATTVVLRAVTRGEDNKDWAAATPQAEFSLTIKNPGAAAALADALGKEFYVDITPVPGSEST